MLGFPLAAVSTVQARAASVTALITKDPVLQRKSLLPFLLYSFKGCRAKGNETQPSVVSPFPEPMGTQAFLPLLDSVTRDLSCASVFSQGLLR